MPKFFLAIKLDVHINKNIKNTIPGILMLQSSSPKMGNSREKMLNFIKVEYSNECCRENHYMIKTIRIEEDVAGTHHVKFEL